MLNQYLSDTRLLLHDTSGQFYQTSDLINYINQGRNKIAAEGRCIRYLPPSTSGVLTVVVDTPGSGYTTATVSFSAPGWDRQITPTATAVLSSGQLISVTVNTPGLGYVGTPPTVTITGNGSGATAHATLTPANITTTNQEVYTFTAINALIASLPSSAGATGIQNVMGVFNIAASWGTMKPTLQHLSWSDFQAYLRSHSVGLQNYPTIWCQYSQGQNGSVYLWPIPSQQLPMDWDCYCTPIPLVDDTTFEAMPYPWTECVKYYAAYLGFENAQRSKDADRMREAYKTCLTEARTMSDPPFIPDFYPRW